MSKRPSILVSKSDVARSQLETAIQLWFADGDPVSIHTLAVATHDCLNAMSKLKGKPSLSEQWLKTQPKKIQQWAREPQNFFKHGQRFLKRSLHYVPSYGDMLIFDCTLCYEFVFGKMTPLMDVFMFRFVLSNPDQFKGDLKAFVESKRLKIEEIEPLGRSEFLARTLPLAMTGGGI